MEVPLAKKLVATHFRFLLPFLTLYAIFVSILYLLFFKNNRGDHNVAILKLTISTLIIVTLQIAKKILAKDE